MFFCNRCAAERGWPKSVFRSKGKCEACGESSICNDVPSSQLPDEIEESYEEIAEYENKAIDAQEHSYNKRINGHGTG